jgi:flagellar protein FliS
MLKEQINTFSTRITQASKLGLVGITYEIILSYIQNAKDALDNDDTSIFNSEIKEAQKFLRDLQTSLDMKQAISRELMALYIYCNKQFVLAIVKKSAEPLTVITTIITNLHSAYSSILKKGDLSPAMTNTEQLYAGLTYGKHSLNETTLYSEQRGYKA